MSEYKMETPEQHAKRIKDEQDDEEYEINKQKHKDEDWERQVRQQKRHAVVEKYKEELNAMLLRRKGITFRKYFVHFVRETASTRFATDDKEYDCIGKPDRNYWTDSDKHKRTFTKKESEIIRDIVFEFGAYDY